MVLIIEIYDPKTKIWSASPVHVFSGKRAKYYAQQTLKWLPTVNFYNKFRITRYYSRRRN